MLNFIFYFNRATQITCAWTKGAPKLYERKKIEVKGKIRYYTYKTLVICTRYIPGNAQREMSRRLLWVGRMARLGKTTIYTKFRWWKPRRKWPLTHSVAPEPEGSSPHSQQPTTSPYPEPGECTPHPQLISLRSVLIPFSHLRLALSSGLFPSCFQKVATK
jgi:hypothetical protein